jgi:uncharacterized membrane protein YukC
MIIIPPVNVRIKIMGGHLEEECSFKKGATIIDRRMVPVVRIIGVGFIVMIILGIVIIMFIFLIPFVDK